MLVHDGQENLNHRIPAPRLQCAFCPFLLHRLVHHEVLQELGSRAPAIPARTSSLVPSVDHAGSYLVPPSEGLPHPLDTISGPSVGPCSLRRCERLVARATHLSTCWGFRARNLILASACHHPTQTSVITTCLPHRDLPATGSSGEPDLPVFLAVLILWGLSRYQPVSSQLNVSVSTMLSQLEHT